MSGAIIIRHIEEALDKKKDRKEGGRDNPICVACMKSNIEKNFWRGPMASCTWRNCPMFEAAQRKDSQEHIRSR